MQFYKINFKSPIFIKLATLFIVLFVIFVPKGNLFKLFSNKDLNLATAFQSYYSGNWNNMHTWGLTGGLTGINQPFGLAVNTNGDVYVSEVNGRVVTFNPDGTGSTSGTITSGVYQPHGVAISKRTGDIYVTNYYQNKINIFNPDGTASTTYTNISTPYFIALSLNDDIYISHSTNAASIDVFNPDGTASTTSFHSNQCCGRDSFTGVDVDSAGNVYGADVIGNIWIFNPDGTASTTFSSVANDINGIKFNNGYIYVVDSGDDIIKVLNLDGTASTTYTGSFDYPNDIGFGPNGNIYIIDRVYQGGGHLFVLNPDGTASSTRDGLDLPASYVQVSGRDYPGIDDNIILYAGPVTLTQDESVHNITFYNSSSILDLNGHTLHVSGNWTNTTGGTLITNGGTVDFVGTSSQKILGTTIFENLTKISSTSGSSLLFDPTSLTTITNNLLLYGDANNLLTIGPSTGSIAPFFSGKLGNGKSGFYYPRGIVIGQHGNIYVADLINQRIAVLNPDGTASTSYNMAPAYTNAVAISPTGEIYVADSNSSNIIVLNPDGTASTTYNLFPSFGTVSGTGISFAPNGEIYVTDGGGTGSGRILVLNPDGTASTSYSDLSPLSPSVFAYPQGAVTISSTTGEIYLADSFNNRIIVLNPDGTASTSYSEAISPISFTISSTTGEFYTVGSDRIVILNPDGTASTTYSGVGAYLSGIAMSPDGYLYITDQNANQLLVLNQDGTASTSYSFAVPGGFTASWGIGHDNNGNIYVSDSGINNIQKFDSSGHFIKAFDTLPAGVGVVNSINVDNDGNVYVVDKIYATSIYKFNSDGHFISSTTIADNIVYIADQMAIDSGGNIFMTVYLVDENKYAIAKIDSNFNIIASTTQADGLDLNPYYGVTIDPSKQFLYAYDAVHIRIVKLNVSDLSFISSISTNFDGIGQLSLYSVATDKEGNIIGITNGNNIIKISPSGEVLSFFAGNGSDDGQLYSPKQIMADSNDVIYVTDTHNLHSIPQKFTPFPFTPFQISAPGSTTLAFLQVEGSRNTDYEALHCVTYCLNIGSNTNWTFPRRSRPEYIYNQTPPTVPSPIPNLNIIGITSPTIVEQPNQVSIPIPIQPTLPQTQTFTKNLQQGMVLYQVKLLQQFLNTHGYRVSTTGAGSQGHETTYFGLKTKLALIKFQNAHNIPATGYFGSVTRAIVNNILK